MDIQPKCLKFPLLLFILGYFASCLGCPLHSGEGNYALCFNYDTWVVLPTNLSQSVGPEMTFEAWIQVGVIQSQFGPTPNNFNEYDRLNLNRPIVSRYRTDISHPDNVLNDFNLQIIPEGQLGFFMGGGSHYTDNLGNPIPVYGVNFLCNLTLESFRWYHVAFTIFYDDPILWMFPSAVRIQVDYWFTTLPIEFEHVEPWDNTYKARRNYLVNESIVLGGYQNADPLWPQGQYYVGKMDEVRLWKGVRSAEEIFYYQNRSVHGDEPWLLTRDSALIASYNFNEDNGTILHSQFHDYNGQIYTAWNNTPHWCLSEVQITTYIYLKAGAEPPLTQIPLYGQDVEDFPFVYYITYNISQLGGVLLQYNGSQIVNGSQVLVNGTQVYVYYNFTAEQSGVYEFTYYITDGHCFSWKTLVVIVVDCCFDCTGCRIDCKNPNTTIKKFDICGVCGGNGTSCLGCDGIPFSGKVYDVCGVCGGNGTSCLGCDGVPNSGKVYDACGICGGNNKTMGICGCNYDNTSCLGCDGVPNSGKVYDICGVCCGNNGSCQGCDGSGGGVYDACGVCNGDNSTCGGCDGMGGQYDGCGVCNGDNSTCQCVEYKGFYLQEMDYALLLWTVNHTVSQVDIAISLLYQTLSLLECYRGDVDFGAVIQYLASFSGNCLNDYLTAVDLLYTNFDQALIKKLSN